jgi:hypothetical protein
MSNSLANTVETVTLAGAYALTSCATGLVIDALFPEDIPLDDAKVTEMYRVLLSFRGSDAPPPIGDGIPWFFFFSAQPNLLKKVAALNDRVRTQLLARLYPIPETKDSGAAPEGGNPVGVIDS